MSFINKKIILADELATSKLARDFALAIKQQNLPQPDLVVYLNGDLGAGKTCFSRSFIQEFLPEARVKSPTYTLVESYQTENLAIHHFDLYRLCDPEELEFLAIRDLLTPPFITLIEWPAKGSGFIPKADFELNLEISSIEGQENPGRELNFIAKNKKSENILNDLIS